MNDWTPFTLTILPERLAVCRLTPETETPAWAWSGPLQSVTRTADELSIVCAVDSVPEGIQSETGWRAMKVDGPLDFSMVGALASLARTLAAAGISIFVISTYDTDYLLARNESIDRAEEALRAAGHRVL